MDVSRIFAQHFPKLGPDLTDGTPYTTNLQVFLRPWVGSMNIKLEAKILGSMNLIKIKKRPRHAKKGGLPPPLRNPPACTFSGGGAPKSDQIFEFVP